MDDELMRAMLDGADYHWWFKGRARVIEQELERLPLPPHARILDAGCGAGQSLEQLVRHGEVHGVEANAEAAEVARARECAEVRVGRLEQLDWSSGEFDLITCLDVLEHIPDEDAALLELHRVAKPGGRLLLTVPAYPRLWSRHDELNHHQRRYTRRTLRAAAERTAWQLERMTSFNSLLLPIAATVRLGERRKRNGRLDLERGPTWLHGALEWPFELESRWLAHGRTLPAGLSLLAVLQKPAHERGTQARSGPSSSAHELMQ